MQNLPRKVQFYKTFDDKIPAQSWLDSLRDIVALSKILTRLKRLQLGNYGDYKYLRDGIYELRIKHGPGYRVYYANDGIDIIVLLLVGDKSTQKKDIMTSIRYWNDHKKRSQK
tara:strand:- start:5339 stop:5677 length:339 start_codon:yes stop_codon:yes gene_type:complete